MTRTEMHYGMSWNRCHWQKERNVIPAVYLNWRKSDSRGGMGIQCCWKKWKGWEQFTSGTSFLVSHRTGPGIIKVGASALIRIAFWLMVSWICITIRLSSWLFGWLARLLIRWDVMAKPASASQISTRATAPLKRNSSGHHPPLVVLHLLCVFHWELLYPSGSLPALLWPDRFSALAWQPSDCPLQSVHSTIRLSVVSHSGAR